jgi:hypothetical protein
MYKPIGGRVFRPHPTNSSEGPKYVQQMNPIERWTNGPLSQDRERELLNVALSSNKKVWDGIEHTNVNPVRNKFVVFDDTQVLDKIPEGKLSLFHGGEKLEQIDRPLWATDKLPAAESYAYMKPLVALPDAKMQEEAIARRLVSQLVVSPQKMGTQDDLARILTDMGQSFDEYQMWQNVDPSFYSDGPAKKNAELVVKKLKKQGFDAMQFLDSDYDQNDILSWFLLNPNAVKKLPE